MREEIDLGHDHSIQFFAWKPDRELNPQHAFALQTRGILHFFTGDYPAALQDETSAMKADPSDGYSVIWLYLA